jgi:16S rRNA (cytidine1402-2'-O)-methyltransferase
VQDRRPAVIGHDRPAKVPGGKDSIVARRAARSESPREPDRGAREPSRGGLLVVATPIGNLADLSPRAREVLGAADLILAEDTRHTSQLLRACSIERPMLSLHEHNEAARVPEILERLRAGETIALVSDAGTPLISDPGFRLVQAAAAEGHRVSAVPGACAAIVALSVAGLPTDRFAFEGFLPNKPGARRRVLEALRGDTRTLVFYEAPHRLQESLEELSAVMGADRNAVVGRELTKMFESVYRGSLGQLAQRAAGDADMTRGEAVIVVEGASCASDKDPDVDRVLAVLLTQLPVKQASELAAQLTGAARNDVYSRALALMKSRAERDS